MLPTFARLVKAGTSEHGIERAALVIDIREGTFSQLRKATESSARGGTGCYVCFSKASDAMRCTPLQRDASTHPADKDKLLSYRERSAMARIRSTPIRLSTLLIIRGTRFAAPV